MVVLDTNVISEMMRAAPDPAVLAWLDGQMAAGMFVTAVTEAEIRFGIARLPEGSRWDSLTVAADTAFDELFRGRVLSFDRHAARACPAIAAHRFAISRPIQPVRLPDRGHRPFSRRKRGHAERGGFRRDRRRNRQSMGCRASLTDAVSRRCRGTPAAVTLRRGAG